MQRSVASFDGVKINYDISRVAGSDAFLVFIHGAGGDLAAWKTERLFFRKKGISTLAVDLRGHGKSGRPDLPEDYQLEKMAKDVREVIAKENITKCIVVGHCFGGVVTIMFHKLFPAFAKSYILVDTTYKAPKTLKSLVKGHAFFVGALNAMLKTSHKRNFSHADYGKFVGTGDWNLRRILSDISHTSFKSWLFTYENLAEFDGVATLKSMKKPVLIIEGKEDSIFDVSMARTLKKLVRSSTLDIIPNANHIIVLNNPETLERAIHAFVTSIKGFVNEAHSSCL